MAKASPPQFRARPSRRGARPRARQLRWPLLGRRKPGPPSGLQRRRGPAAACMRTARGQRHRDQRRRELTPEYPTEAIDPCPVLLGGCITGDGVATAPLMRQHHYAVRHRHRPAGPPGRSPAGAADRPGGPAARPGRCSGGAAGAGRRRGGDRRLPGRPLRAAAGRAAGLPARAGLHDRALPAAGQRARRGHQGRLQGGAPVPADGGRGAACCCCRPSRPRRRPALAR
jgi:hypothetical protein